MASYEQLKLTAYFLYYQLIKLLNVLFISKSVLVQALRFHLVSPRAPFTNMH